MEWITGVDWSAVFLPQTPLLEIFVRGTITYLGIFFLLRILKKREIGSTNTTDILVIVLLADAAQNAMADNYRSIIDGLLLVSTILFWSTALNWLGFHFPPMQRLLYSEPLVLVENGRLKRRNMRHELITEEELMRVLRSSGVEDVSQVQRVIMESDGEISVISKKQAESQIGE